ncbi:MAG: hypothetical protein ACFCUG_00205 [Thiotrichales bacterium]
MVRGTAHALAQLRHIHDYIAQDAPRYSCRILCEIKTSHIDILATIHKRRDLQVGG